MAPVLFTKLTLSK